MSLVSVVGKYSIGQVLGEGTFGKVKLATHMQTGEKYAMKIIDKRKLEKQGMEQQVKREISILKQLKHKHIVGLHEILASQTKIYIVLELVTGGELFDKIVQAGKFDENTARKYFQQLIDGIQYCHDRDICHRDLKPENLLLDADETLKISDFGLGSLQKGVADVLQTPCGTPNYVAPEVLKNQGYDGKTSDIWSLGVILYVMIAGALPFDDNNTAQLFKKISSADYKCPSHFSPGVRALIGKILVPDPHKRYTLAQIKADPWFVEGYNTNGGASGAAAARQSASKQQSVGSVDGGGDVFQETQDGDVDFDNDPEDNASNVRAPGPITLNAFDLISMSGALDLNRMLQSKMAVSRATRFLVERDAAETLSLLRATLDAIDPTSGLRSDVSEQQFKVKCSDSKISFAIQILQLTPKLHVVDFKRGRGDILTFQQYYRFIAERMEPYSKKQ